MLLRGHLRGTSGQGCCVPKNACPVSASVTFRAGVLSLPRHPLCSLTKGSWSSGSGRPRSDYSPAGPPNRRAWCCASAPSHPALPDSNPEPGNNRVLWAALAAFAGAAALCAIILTPQGIMFKDMLVNGPLGRSGFLAAFSLIFLSEIGDKTFFIAALLAMKVGKWISFSASLTSLSVMTIISVAIGVVFSRVPDALKSSVPVGEIAGCALLVFFGIRALREGLKSEDGSGADEELAEADEAVKAAEEGGKVKRGSNPIQAFVEVATLIFVAEWGDRSMLATVALGAAQNPVGVAAGAIVGHAIATGIAVVGGAMASKHVSEKQINIASGILFLLFAAATVFSMF